MKKLSKRLHKALTEERQYSAREMADFVADNVPELREAFTRADIDLALDDRGWLVPGRLGSTGCVIL